MTKSNNHFAKQTALLPINKRAFKVTKSQSNIKQSKIRKQIKDIIQEKTKFNCSSCHLKSIILLGPKEYQTYTYSIKCKECRISVNTTLEKLQKNDAKLLQVFCTPGNPIKTIKHMSTVKELLNSSPPSSPERENTHGARKRRAEAVKDLQSQDKLIMNLFMSHLNRTKSYMSKNTIESTSVQINEMIENNQIEVAKSLKETFIGCLNKITRS